MFPLETFGKLANCKMPVRFVNSEYKTFILSPIGKLTFGKLAKPTKIQTIAFPYFKAVFIVI